MNGRAAWKSDRLPITVLVMSAVLVFGAGAVRLGFYYDDAGFLARLPSAGLSGLWGLARDYVPGRNLHMVWQYLLFELVGDPVAHLPALHLLQSALDAALITGFYLLLRRFGISAPAALLAAGLFAFWPNHGETHYWLSAAPQNQFSTLFVLLFAWTSLDLATGAPWTRRWWFWLVDAAAFVFALFTYDQVVLVLLGIGVLRVIAGSFRGAGRNPRFLISHVVYLLIAIEYIHIKLAIRPGEAPRVNSGVWSLVSMNASNTLSFTAGKLWRLHVSAIYERATRTDWWIALTSAAAIAAVSAYILRQPAEPKSEPPRISRSAALFVLAFLFYVLAYVPIWVWYPTSRHHFLPSIGLFAAAAVLLDQALQLRTGHIVHLVTLLLCGAGILFFTVACRGESRCWETSFVARKRFFEEIKPHIQGKKILVLQGFSQSLGPAPLVLPHDALYGPRLFYGASFGRGVEFVGDLGSAPAPRGIFLGTAGEPSMLGGIRYYDTNDFLVVRFVSWEDSRLNFEANPPRPLRYSLVSSGCVSSGSTAFSARVASARRKGSDVMLQVDINATLPPQLHLAATLGFLHGHGFYPWAEINHPGGMNHLVMLVPAQGACTETWRLHDFPKTDRVRLQFFAASDQSPPTNLGQAEAAIAP